MSLVVRCPSCLGEASIPAALAGQSVLCPRCEGRFAAPENVPLPKPKVVAAVPAPPPPEDRKYCTDCGQAIRRKAVICMACGVAQNKIPDAPAGLPVLRPFGDAAPKGTSSNRVVAGLLGIFLGTFGIHKFVLGYTTEGLVMLLVSVIGIPCSGGAGSVVMWVIGLIEGIMYLAKSDKDFHETYVVHRKGWF